MVSELVQIGEFVRVTAISASCRECGKIAKGKGCKHVSAHDIEAAQQRLKTNLKERALLQDDRTALGELIAQLYREVIVLSVRNIRPDLKQSDDDFQTAALKIIELIRERKGNFSPDTLQNFTRWVRNTARVTGFNLLKKETQYKAHRSGYSNPMEGKVSVEEDREMVNDQAISSARGPVTEACHDEMRKLVQSGLERLQNEYGKMYSEPLRLWAVENLGVKEIAEKTGVGANVARKRLDKARELLRDLLRGDCHTLYRMWEKQLAEKQKEEENPV
jgi:DNA-directed RNA polymerase specialized sigma24 family protein